MQEDEQIDFTTTSDDTQYTHKGFRFMDIMNAASVLQSLHSWTGVTAIETRQQLSSSNLSSFQLEQPSDLLSDFEDRMRPSPNTLDRQYGTLEHGSTGREASSTAVSNDDGLALVGRVSGVDALKSYEADGLFLSDFMQEYREIIHE
jgi:hypothetical protein